MMGFFDRFSGRPSEDKFARLVMKTLREVGDRREATYDEANFCINLSEPDGEEGTLNLRNLYLEYCAAKKSERAAMLRRSCIAFARHFEVPEDFEDARHDLLPAVRPRSMAEVMRLEAEVRGAGAQWAELAALPLSEHLETCLVYDLPTAMHFVTKDMLEKWGVSLYEAAEVARQNLEQREFMVGKVGDHLYVFVTGDAFDAARMLLLEPIRSLELKGEPVAIPINRESLMLSGADDADGLEILAALAEKKLDEARPICPIAHKLVGDEWTAWLPPADHPQHEKLKRLQVGHLFREYAEQKSLLDKRNEQTGEDVFVATFSAAERGGQIMSYCVWSKGVPSWLPQTDFVGLYDPEADETAFVRWDRLQATCAFSLTALEAYPPRWLVGEFPTVEQLRRLEPEKWQQSSG